MKCSCSCPSGLENFSPMRPSICHFPLMLIWRSNPHKAAKCSGCEDIVCVTLPPQLPESKFTKFSSSFMNILAPVHCRTHTIHQLLLMRFPKVFSPGPHGSREMLTLHRRVHSWSPVTVLTAAYHKHYLILCYVHRCEINRRRVGVLSSGVNFGLCHGGHTQSASTLVSPNGADLWTIKLALLPERACKDFLIVMLKQGFLWGISYIPRIWPITNPFKIHLHLCCNTNILDMFVGLEFRAYRCK